MQVVAHHVIYSPGRKTTIIHSYNDTCTICVKVYNNNHDLRVCTQILTSLAIDPACVMSRMSREHSLLMFPPLLLKLYYRLFLHQAGPDPAWLRQRIKDVHFVLFVYKMTLKKLLFLLNT
jgi:hypothetical protein